MRFKTMFFIHVSDVFLIKQKPENKSAKLIAKRLQYRIVYLIQLLLMKKRKLGSGGIRTHASEETGALNQRLRPFGHATGYRNPSNSNQFALHLKRVSMGLIVSRKTANSLAVKRKNEKNFNH